MKIERLQTFDRIPEYYAIRIRRKRCPGCDKKKTSWRKRGGRITCSEKCSAILSRSAIHQYYQGINRERLEIDNFTCQLCGVMPTTKITLKYSHRQENQVQEMLKNGLILEYEKKGKEPLDYFEAVVMDQSELRVDHNTPIALGGEQFSLENLRTLCVTCHKIKTYEDIKIIRYAKKQLK